MNMYSSKSGSAAARMQRVQHAMGLSDRQMARLLKISPRAITGLMQSGHGVFPEEHRRRLVRLDLIAALAARVYTHDGVRQFFATPLAGFGEKNAIELLLEGHYDSVAGAIAADYQRSGSQKRNSF